MLMVLTRLFYLQVVEGDKYRDDALEASLRRAYATPRRGTILTRDGVVLAEDRPHFDIVILPSKLDRKRAVYRRLSRLREYGRVRTKLLELRVDGEGAVAEVEVYPKDCPPVRERLVLPVTEKFLQVARNMGRVYGLRLEEFYEGLVKAELRVVRGWAWLSTPFPVIRSVPFERARVILLQPEAFTGVGVRAVMSRVYPQGALLAHTIGYVGAVSSKEGLKRGESALLWYTPEDRVGRAGIERSLEKYLRGERGYEIAMVDVRGRKRSELLSLERLDGADVVLTVDSRLQRVVEQAIRGKTAAVVIMDVRTGAVLALASSPSYKPGELRKEFRELASNPESPLLNRVVAGLYPAGSVFKVFVGIAALESRRCPAYVNCTGRYVAGFSCFAKWGHGAIRLEEAIEKSCNIFFYETASSRYLGARRLVRVLELLGFGERTGIELPFEARGILPTPEWKRSFKSQPWYPGDSFNLAIGQGELLVTPLQVVRAISALANGGRVLKPTVVSVCLRSGEALGEFGLPQLVRGLHFKIGNLERVRRGMVRVTNSPGGTAYRAFRDWSRNWNVAGKTGTAERYLRGKQDNVGWFAGFAPASDPRIAFAVVVEHLGKDETGGRVCAPIARQILESMPEELLK